MRRLGDAARPRAGGFLDRDRVRRRVVSGKVVERDTLRSFATDGLLQNGTQLGGSCVDCQLAAQAWQSSNQARGLDKARVA